MMKAMLSLGRGAFWRQESPVANPPVPEVAAIELSPMTANPLNTDIDLEANIQPPTTPLTPSGLQPMFIAQGPGDENVPEGELVVAGALGERINERFFNDYQLRLMKDLPEVSQLLEFTTMITPTGVHQLAMENKDNECRHLRCLINADEFRLMFGSTLSHNLLVRAVALTDPNGILLHDNTMTLEQLNQLEETILNKQGHPLFGRSINEKTYLKAVDMVGNLFCRGTSKFPPLPEASSTRLLHATRHNAVLTTTASLRMAAQSTLLLNYAVSVYFLDISPNSGDDYTFYIKYTPMIFSAFLGLTLFCLLTLNVSPANQPSILIGFERTRKIEQSVISWVSNLTNYGPDLFLSTTNIQALFLPTILLGILLGFCTPLKDPVKNIAEYSLLKFVFNNLLKSLTVGSLCGLGMQAPINDGGFLYNYSLDGYNKFEQDVKMSRYTAAGLTFIFLSMIHPNNPVFIQTFGRYAGNAMNGMSMVLLDNYALTGSINSAFTIFYGSFSKEEPVVPSLYCFLNYVCLTSILLITFPSTPNLGSYSTEKNPYKSPFQRRVEAFFKPLSSCELTLRTQPILSSDQITNLGQNSPVVTRATNSNSVLATEEPRLNSMEMK